MFDDHPDPSLSAGLVDAVLTRFASAARRVEQLAELPVAELNAIPHRSALQVQLLHNRGIAGRDAIEAFLGRDWRHAGAPLPNLERAVERLRLAVTRQERVTVYGDYDADGMTSCAILTLALQALGAQVDTYIPQRTDDGRGLNSAIVAELAKQGRQVLVTTDCGSANVEEAAQAIELGMEVIITDHHPLHGALPEAAYAIVNPLLAPAPGEHADLSGAGVAFRVAEALLSSAGRGEFVETLLDLVAVGTIGDIVPLSGENWALTRAGMERLKTQPRPGLRALLELAAIPSAALSERDISFGLVPRLNAAARLGAPQLALALLMAEQSETANELATTLDQLNGQRQQLLEEMMTSARPQAEAQLRGDNSVVIVKAPGWHLGIIGLVASKLAEEYARPAFAISMSAGECRGSGRGPLGSQLVDVLSARADLFVRFGGHRRAAGFTVASDRLAELEAYLRSAAGLEMMPGAVEGETDVCLRVDCRLALRHVGPTRFSALRTLAPFGQGFEEPVFICQRVRISQCWRSGKDGRTLRLRLRDDTGERVAIWSQHGDWCESIARALPHLPLFDAIFRLSARQPRFGSEPEVTPQIVMLRPTQAR